MTKRRTFQSVKELFRRYALDLTRTENKSSPRDFDYVVENNGTTLAGFKSLKEASDWFTEFQSGKPILNSIDRENVVDELRQKTITIIHKERFDTWGKNYEFITKLQEHFARTYNGSLFVVETDQNIDGFVDFRVDGEQPSEAFYKDLEEVWHDFKNAWNNGGV